MSQFFYIHPDNPQARLISQAVRLIQQGGVVIYPTDSAYALGCHLDDRDAVNRIRQIRGLDEKHNFTLMCRDLSDLGVYAKVSNTAYRFIKHLIPGPYTFLLPATKEVPRRMQHPKRKSIGLRVPDNNIVQALLEVMGEPIISSTLLLPGDEYPMQDPEEIRDRFEHAVDCVIHGGNGDIEQTTVIDLREDHAEVVREGKGSVADYL